MLENDSPTDITPADAKPGGDPAASRPARRERFAASRAGDMWSRLDAVDFINQAMILAALLMLCIFPFLILLAAVKNVDFVTQISRHMGLNRAASEDVRKLFGPSSGTLAAVTLGTVAWLVLMASGVAAVVRDFYLRVFEVEPKDARSSPSTTHWAARMRSSSWSMSV